MFKELQYNKKFYIRMIILVMVFACGMSIFNVLQMLGTNYVNLSVFDYYVLNLHGGTGVENIISCITPIVLAVVIGSGYNFYRQIDISLFTRLNQKSFVYKRAVKSFIIGFVFEILFYLLCFFYTIIICMIFNSEMRFGVSFDLMGRTILPSFYYDFPLLYLGVYILLCSMFGGLFTLVSYYSSLCTKNNIIIFLAPYIYIILNIIMCEVIPFGHYFNYNNLNIIDPTTYAYYGSDLLYIIMIPLSVMIQLSLCIILIRIKGKKDLC